MAHAVGHRSGDAVSHLVSRFNQEGIAALELRHGGGRQTVYDVEKRKLILQLASSLDIQWRTGGFYRLTYNFSYKLYFKLNY